MDSFVQKWLLALLSVLFCLELCTAGNVTVGKEYPFNAFNPTQSVFRWIDSSRALLLQTVSNRVYFTQDGGMTWTDLSAKLEGSTTPGSEPGFLYPNNIDPNKVYIRGNGEMCWRSYDKGNTWEAFRPKPSLLYRNLLWHPYNSAWALAGVETASPRRIDLYLTQDFGSTWKLIQANITRANTYNWGDAGKGSVPMSRIYYVKEDVNNQYLDFYETDDFGASPIVVISKTRGFIFLDNQLFVAVYLPNQDETILKVSPHIGRKYKVFYEARFPFGKTLNYEGYSLLDDSTGAVFLGVNHEDYYAQWGNLYLSDSLGISYATSLLHVSQSRGRYDFTKVNGLDGIYVANTVVDWEDKESQNVDNILQSYITFNNGGEWKMIQRAFYDIDNKPIECTGICQLHIHGFTSGMNEEGESYGPFYSSVNTIGLLIANGNVGQYLSHVRSDVSTYLSRDAGLNWVELRKGPSIYEFGDQGGILVLAPTGELTTKVYYSLDQGLTALVPLEFTSSPVYVINIISDPSASGFKFMILAVRQSQGVIIGLDFSSVFSRKCDSVKDYEGFTPKDGKQNVNGLNCLLGRDVTYRRRKQDSYCANIPNVQKPLFSQNCSCTDDDWECDYGYELSGGSCVQVIAVEYPPPECEPGMTYYKTKGYRKVAGNTCEGGVQHEMEGPFDCPSNKDKLNLKSNKGWIAAVVIIPVVLLLLVGAFFALRSEKLRDKVPVLKFFHDWRVGYFNMKNAPNDNIIDDQELAFSNMDEDAEQFVNDNQTEIDINSTSDEFDPRK